MALRPDTHAHLLAHHRDFGAFADALSQSHGGRFDSVFWAFAQQYAPAAPARVVDLGTGPGLLLPELALRFEGADIVGVDGQPEMVARARAVAAGVPGLRVIDHDLSAGAVAGIDAGSVDLVIASMLLHEMQVPTLLLDEIARMLRPGGVVILSDWIRFPLHRYAEERRPETLDAFVHFSEHCRYTADDLVWLAECSGFRVLECLTRRSGSKALMALARVDAPGPGAADAVRGGGL